MLSGTLTATVLGPAAISVADARVEEADGATLDFVVSLSRAAIGTVTVNYATEGGDAEEDIDYVAAEGTLIFVEGDQEKTVSVQVINDSHDEDPETMTLHLSDATGAYIADGVATGTIENSDPLQKAWLARFGRTVASHVVDALETRLDGASQSFVRVGGYRLGGAPEVMDTVQRLAPDSSLWSQQDLADEASGHDVTARDLLLRSAFHLVANDAEGAVGPRLSAWGRVSTSSFDGREDRLSLDGTVTTATLGVDGVWKRWLTGLALAYSDADGSFSEAGTAGGDLASTLTSVHPYVAYAPTARVRLWGMLGHGSGALQLRPAGQRAMDTDLQMTMGAVGIRGALLEPPPGGGLALALRSDVLWVRTDSDAVAGAAGSLAAAQADVSRLRLVLEGSRPRRPRSRWLLHPVAGSRRAPRRRRCRDGQRRGGGRSAALRLFLGSEHRGCGARPAGPRGRRLPRVGRQRRPAFRPRAARPGPVGVHRAGVGDGGERRLEAVGPARCGGPGGGQRPGVGSRAPGCAAGLRPGRPEGPRPAHPLRPRRLH